jgi:NAD(P)-dependent dehydrogenase (short-subunit alcohol dehydrogenase family)
MSATPSRAVLITGCSTGIGRAAAERLAAKGWPVYATARRLESIKDLGDAGCQLLTLDVCDEDSMRAAVSEVESREGAVFALVNNAGYGQEGAVEEVPMEDIRRVFETNVFGLSRLTQLALPGMRRQGAGRIVNVSSMGGKVSIPGGGYYHATKHAVEAISDTLRFEVRPFGVHVSVIEPGTIKTKFGDTATNSVEHLQDPGSPYATFNKVLVERINDAYEGKLARFAAPPEAVAKVIDKAISSRLPRTRYRVTLGARVMLATRKVTPDRAWDLMLRTQFPSKSN